MAKGYRSWYWHLGLASLLTLGGAMTDFKNCSLAQIAPDNTLGAESSVVTPNVDINALPSDQIDGGAKRGANLFHSFREFNIEQGRGAYFTSPDGIANILSRVTGGHPSNILGTLGVRGGSANLFLLNPNGIIFGPTSSLDVGGSFVATTANAIGFAEQGFFSASAPDVPSVLTINPSAFLFNQIVAQPISSQSVTGLQVPTSDSLLLLGGNVSLNGGDLQTPGGRVELGGLATAGSIGLSMNGSLMSLSFPDNMARADVYLTAFGSDPARINVAGGNGGSIAITARNIEISGDSVVLGGLETGLGFPGAQAGDITLHATGKIALTNSGGIANDVEAGAVGNGGGINITTGSLSVTNGVQLQALTRGQGNAGSVNINARDTVSFDGVGSDGYSSAVFSSVESGGVGNGGGINITTGSLSVTNGAQLQALTDGQGNAGSVNINARDTVFFDGVGSNEYFSAAFSGVASGGVGNGGSINITTGSLSVTNGGGLNAQTRGQGNAGSVNINARDTVSFDGGVAFSTASLGGVGNGGSINITTGSLSVTNGARLGAQTRGRGNAGGVNINARDTVSFDDGDVYSTVALGGVGKGGGINITTGSLSATNGAQLQALTRGQGNAGSVSINARDTVSFDGVDSDGYPSAALSTVESGGVGNGGGINITTGSLSVTNGAGLSAGTLGQGNAGSVNLNARDTISFDGVGNNGYSSVALSNVDSGGVGNGGDINITTGSLSVTNGAGLSALTLGQGNAGSVNINARDTVSFDGGGVFSTVASGAVGNGGDINITTGSLSVTNGAGLSASSEGNGAAGNIEVEASSIRLEKQAFLSSDTTGGEGDIFLRSQDLVLRRGSSITTNAFGTATGGNITIDTGVIAALENSDISADAEAASGGQVRINAQGIFGTEFRNQPTSESDITASSRLGLQFSGSVEINTSNVDLNQGLVTLPVELVNVEGLIANSCIARSSEQGGNFNITGAGGLPTRPGDATVSPYPTGTVRSILDSGGTPSSSQASPVPSTNEARKWKMGDPIVEPQGVYRLANGELVLSRECSH